MNNPEDKRYDPNDTTLKFVKRKDEITGDDSDVLRVEMSCGHAVDPNSLTGWCRSLIDQGHWKFHCPADVDGKKCNKEWTYIEVRRHALLTDEEQAEFEEKLASVAAEQYCEYKSCPGCKSFVERKDLTNLRVMCSICTAENKHLCEFCWQCLKPWKGSGKPSDRCENGGCTSMELKALQNCKIKDLPGSAVKGCPSIRACPTCGKLIEHKEMCKYMMCNRCHVEFCFACLEVARVCQKSSSSFVLCAKPIAPKQTRIPVWTRQSSNQTPSQAPTDGDGSCIII